jgi:hypothetical protein
MLWKTIPGTAAAGSGESRNCEARHRFKFPAPGNFAANLSFVRPENLKLCPNWAKIRPCSGNGAGISGNFAATGWPDSGYDVFGKHWG